MSESKSKLASTVSRLSQIAQEAASLVELCDEICESIDPDELQRLIAPLRRALNRQEPQA